MIHHIKKHVKKHGHKILAITTVIALLTVAFVYRPSQFDSTQAAASQDWKRMLNSADAVNQNNEKIVRSSAGNYYVAWEEEDGSGVKDIYISKFNANGTQIGSITTVANVLAEHEDQIELVADNADGVIIAYRKQSTTNQLYYNHLNSSMTSACTGGTPTWVYGVSTNDASNHTIMHDGSGGAYVAWEENSTFYMTHLGSTCGQYATWDPVDTPHVGPYTAFRLYGVQEKAQLIPGNANEVIWAGINNSSDLVVTHKIDDTGAYITGWTGTKYIYNPGSQVNGNFSIASDGSGGLVAAEFPNLNPKNTLWITHLNSDGSADTTWPGGTGTITLSTSMTGIMNAQIIKDDSDNFIVAWDDFWTNYHVYGQKVSSAGVAQWNSGNPLQLSTSTTPYMDGSYNYVVSDDSGGAFIGYYDSGASQVQYVKSDGTLDFGSTGYNSGISALGYMPNMVKDGSGGMIWTTIDRAGGDDFDVYAERVSSVIPAPDINWLDPDYDGLAGGSTISIHGAAFTGVTNVTIDGTSCTSINLIDDTEVECTIPAGGTAGTTDVIVYTPAGNSGGDGIGMFTYYDAPTVTTTMDPDHGPAAGGTIVYFEGTNFGQATEVTVDGEKASISDIGSTYVQFSTPAGTEGTTVDVRVINPVDQSVLVGEFSYDELPGAWAADYIVADYPSGGSTPQDYPRSIRTSDGNFMVFWRDSHPTTENYVLYAKKISSTDGSTMAGWVDDGISVTDLTAHVPQSPMGNWKYEVVSDNDGGAYVVWDYSIDGRYEVWAQHMSSSGTAMWGGGTGVELDDSATDIRLGIDVATGPNASDGAFVSWIALDAGWSLQGVKTTRLNATTGATEFSPVLLNADAGDFRMIVDSNNKATVAYTLQSDDTQIRTSTITSTGTLSTGISIQAGITDALVTSFRSNDFQITSDDSDGIFIAYIGDNSGTERTYALARRILSTGVFDTDWVDGAGTSGVIISGTDSVGNLNLSSDGSSGAFFIFNLGFGRFSVPKVYTQYVSEAGTYTWNAGNPTNITDTNESDEDELNSYNEASSMVSDGTGGFIFSSFDSGESTVDVQRITNVAGTPTQMWPVDSPDSIGYTLNLYSSGGSARPSIESDGNGAGAVFWRGVDNETGYSDIYGQLLDLDTSGPCGETGSNEACGIQYLECAPVSTSFSNAPNDFELSLGGNRTLTTRNDTTYTIGENNAYFDETTPSVFSDTSDVVSINSNTVVTCGDPSNSVSLTISATPLENVSGQNIMTYGADHAAGGTGINADYYAMFSIITSSSTTCGAGCVEATNNVESNNEQRHGELNVFANDGPNDNALSGTADISSMLVDQNNNTNTVTIYEASEGIEGTIDIPGLTYNLAIPANPQFTGNFTTTVTFTLS